MSLEIVCYLWLDWNVWVPVLRFVEAEACTPEGFDGKAGT